MDKNFQIIKKLQENLKVDPNNVELLNEIAIYYFRIENLIQAEFYYKKALTIDPNNISVLNNLAILKQRNSPKESILLYKKILLINENLFEVRYNLSQCYSSVGKILDAKVELKKILDIKPNFTRADRMLSLITKYTKNDVHFEKMNHKLNNVSLDNKQLSELYFAIGKYYEDINDYENAYKNYLKGNKINKTLYKYDIKNSQYNFSLIKKFDYNKLTINSKVSRKIIFIVGMPRSGTSLVESIISSHSQVFGCGEVGFLNNIIRENFLKNPNLHKENFSKLITNSAERYIDSISFLDNTKNIFTDKNLLNFRHIGFIKYIFPNAKIINCLRNPVDTCWSGFKHYFENSLLFTNDFDDFGKYYNLYEDLMSFWHQKFPNLIYDLNYEKLIDQPQKEISRLLKYCNLSQDKKCFEHHKNVDTIKTSSFLQARQGIYKSAVGSSKPYNIYIKKIYKYIRN